MSDQAAAVRVKHRFTASPERVFDSWLDPEKGAGFFSRRRPGRWCGRRPTRGWGDGSRSPTAGTGRT